MKRILTTTALVLATIGLTGCNIGKSDAWHVGQCMGGKLYSQGMNDIPVPFASLAIMQTSAKYGLDGEEIATGYAEYRKNPGGDYSKSCKVSREIEAGHR